MKKLASLFVATVLVLSVMVSASASEGVFATLSQGARDTRTDMRVADMQKKLIEYGFLNGKADGKFGVKTLAALESFQLANSLPVTGIYDEDDDARLSAADAVNSSGGTGKVRTASTASSSSSSSRSTSSGRTSRRNTHTPDNTRNTPDNTRNSPDNT